jgi:glycosyltransferase involved in cell wall biosynthesis
VVGLVSIKSLFACTLLSLGRKVWVYSTLAQESPFLVRRRKRLLKLCVVEFFDRLLAPHAISRHAFSSWEVRQGTMSTKTFFRGLPIHKGMGFNIAHDQTVKTPELLHEPVDFLYAGRKDVMQKGLDILLEAFARAEPGVLNIHGTDFQGGELVLRSLVSALGISDRVAICEPIDLVEGSSKWFVYTSRFDGPPRPIRAAISAGIPVIVSEETGMGDDVRRYDAGLVCGADVRSVCHALTLAAGMSDDDYAQRKVGV